MLILIFRPSRKFEKPCLCKKVIVSCLVFFCYIEKPNTLQYDC